VALLNDHPICTPGDLRPFEAAMPLDERLPERSVLDVFTAAAERQPERTANAHAQQTIGERHRLPEAQVQVSPGGPRGLVVNVSLPRAAEAALPAVEQAPAG
jgi:non-ribosomal peptide synthetase component F